MKSQTKTEFIDQIVKLNNEKDKHKDWTHSPDK